MKQKRRLSGFLAALIAAGLLAGCTEGADSPSDAAENMSEVSLQQDSSQETAEESPAQDPAESAADTSENLIGDLPEEYSPLNMEYVRKLEALGFPSSPLGAFFDMSWADVTRNEYETDARSQDLTNEILTDEDYDRLTFDTLTVFPETLPENFQPEQVLEDGKNPGLGLHALHEAGYTGKGVNVGIVDQQLAGHREYAGRVRYYADLDEYAPGMTVVSSMHGPAVTSLLGGTTTGVAPEVNIYYVSYNQAGAANNNFEPYVEAINQLLDLNEVLPEEDKMCVISVSRGGFSIYDNANYQRLKQRAAEQGVYLLVVDAYEQYFQYSGRDLSDDPDAASSYHPAVRMLGKTATLDSVYLPADRRSFASPVGPEEYTYYTVGGASWAVPYAAGLFALARQVDADVRFEDFAKIAAETAAEVTVNFEGTVIQSHIKTKPIARESNEITIKVANPAEILRALGAAL